MAVNTGINRGISGHGENSFMITKAAETVRNCDIFGVVFSQFVRINAEIFI